jgi:hypothetical protein
VTTSESRLLYVFDAFCFSIFILNQFTLQVNVHDGLEVRKGAFIELISNCAAIWRHNGIFEDGALSRLLDIYFGAKLPMRERNHHLLHIQGA